MKKWFFIVVGIAIVFNGGWFMLREYYEKVKGVPKSHFVGYLIYGDKYLENRGGRGIPSADTPQAPDVQKPPEPEKPKTAEDIKRIYGEKMLAAKTDNERYEAQITYLQDMYAVEKDTVQKKAFKDQLVEIKAKEFARSNAEILFKKQELEYQEVQRKIQNYKKNGVTPPAKLIKMQKQKPNKDAIYQSLYQQEKMRLSSQP